MTNKFAVLGSPISHSKSPLLHKAAYEFLDLDFEYDIFEVGETELEDFLISKTEYQGFSLTMPLKDAAFEVANSKDPSSVLTSSANTLVRSEDGWVSHNTDVFGIRQALSERLGPQTDSIKRVFILGTGATARSVVAALSQGHPEALVMVWGRSSEKASGVVAFGKSLGLAIDIESDISAGLLEADLSISTLPKGSLDTFWSVFAESDALRPKGYLFDVNYNPWPSAAASAWGNDRVISGLEMLIYQAVKQVRIFAEACDKVITATNEEIAEVMRGAIS